MITFVDLLLDLGEEIYIDMGGAFFLAFCFAPPFTEFPGFIATNVKVWTVE